MLYQWMLKNPLDESNSNSLQCCYFLDEIAPFIPPTSKPQSKESLMLLFKQQFWSVIKLYFYFSVFIFILSVLNFAVLNGKIKFKFNNILIFLIFIFPIYKFSVFNNGILRYDSFPSVMNKYSKININWSFDKEFFRDCKLIKLNFSGLRSLYMPFIKFA